MIIFDKPYVSKELIATAVRLQAGVLNNAMAQSLKLNGILNLLDDQQAVQLEQQREYPLVYCNSENSIGWIAENLSFSDLPEKIHLFKDKYKFRQLLAPLYPEFFFKAVDLEDLDQLDVATLPKPFAIKPSVGFFSLGVHIVQDDADWPGVLRTIHEEMAQVSDFYPREVVDVRQFLIEEIIPGEEYAVDAYFNQQGEPVVLNILHHIFMSEDDVGDRVYMTSLEVIRENLARVEEMLTNISKIAPLRNLPIHMEYRADSNGRCIPIEVNPMRFAGWCVADLADYAYGINVYEHYFKQLKPDWTTLLAQIDGKVYTNIVADVPETIDHKLIQDVDYEGFLEQFSNPITLRKIDYHEYPVFAFLFVEMDAERADEEISQILKMDFTRFIQS
jgi:hypothetical protein